MKTTVFPIDVVEVIDYVTMYEKGVPKRPKLLEGAVEIYIENVAKALLQKDQANDRIRTSDHGDCGRHLWAKVRGLLEDPDFDTRVFRYNEGHIAGAWYAALVAVGVQELYQDVFVSLGLETLYRDVPGHLDLLLSRNIDKESGGYEPGDPEQVIDFKRINQIQPIAAPHVKNKTGNDHRYQILQCGDYALSQKAPHFSLVICGTAVSRKGEDQPENPRSIRMRQFDYDTSEWQDDVDADIDRMLTSALNDQEPPCDCRETWRKENCKSYAPVAQLLAQSVAQQQQQNIVEV
jgi:hypothetical protein